MKIDSKIGVRPVQKLNLLSLTPVLPDAKRHGACSVPVSRCPLLQVVPLDSTPVHT